MSSFGARGIKVLRQHGGPGTISVYGGIAQQVRPLRPGECVRVIRLLNHAPRRTSPDFRNHAQPQSPAIALRTELPIRKRLSPPTGIS